MDKILVSGASGLIGSSLVPFLARMGNEVIPIVRKKGPGIYWNPYKGEIEREKLRGLKAIIHLSGENIASGRWSKSKKDKILESRKVPTSFLSSVVAALPDPKPIFLCASAIGAYSDRGDEILSESSNLGDGFFPDVARAWEGATEIAKTSGARVVNMRFGLVLDPKGGALGKMLLPFKLGLGGPLGSGAQYMSWISIDDLQSAISHLLSNSKLSGPVNMVAPEPVSNEEFTKELGRALKRPTLFRVPAFMLRAIFGELADAAFLSSARVVPKALLDDGFTFKHPKLSVALNHLL